MVAITVNHSTVDGISLNAHKHILAFLKRTRLLCPPQFPKSLVRDLPLVLESLKAPPYKPRQDTKQKCVSQKTAFLLLII